MKTLFQIRSQAEAPSGTDFRWTLLERLHHGLHQATFLPSRTGCREGKESRSLGRIRLCSGGLERDQGWVTIPLGIWRACVAGREWNPVAGVGGHCLAQSDCIIVNWSCTEQNSLLYQREGDRRGVNALPCSRSLSKGCLGYFPSLAAASLSLALFAVSEAAGELQRQV